MCIPRCIIRGRHARQCLSPPQRFPGVFQGGGGGEQARAMNMLEDLGNRMWWARVRFEETIEYYRGSANVRVLTSVI